MNCGILRQLRARGASEVGRAGQLHWLGGVLLAVGVMIAASHVQARGVPDSFADLAEELLPTVVNISTSQVVEPGEDPESFEELFREFFERRGEGSPLPRQRRTSSLGSGFIIDPDGYIVTNHHVVQGADEISVRMYDNTLLQATVIGTDDKTDLAVLKVKTDRPLPAARWGDSDASRVGDWVIAVGNPFGLGGTVTAGIISARQRDINAGPYDDFLQTDAAINRGNSGGPTFNMAGEVIGVNTAIFSPSGGSIGIGFAIPSSMARNIVESLRSFGEVRRGWLGVRIQTVTEELAEGLRLPEASGALVASVNEDGPAAEAGIVQGDVILEFDGRKVPDMRRLPRMVAETPVGKEVEVVVWRRGERQTMRITLGQLDDAILAATPPMAVPEPDGEQTVADLGLTLGALNDDTRQRFELSEEDRGVVITAIDRNGNAADKGLRPGDLIVEVDQVEVSTPAEVVQRVERARDEGYRVVTLLVYRDGEFQWVAVRIG